MKSNDQIAQEQRDYWLDVMRVNRDRSIGQQDPNGEPGLPRDAFSISPFDWAEYWNQQLPGELRR